MSKKVILNADDFGYSPAVNEAVIKACREGVLRHASLMVAEGSAVEAVELACKEPKLKVGLHVSLCQGKAALAADKIPGLVDAQGRFSDDPVQCGMRYFFDRKLRPQLQAEIRAQFEKFMAFGLPPAHVDGHVNVHAHPVVYPIILGLAREFGFNRLRLPGGEFLTSLSFDRWRLGKQLGEAVTFALLRAYLRSYHQGSPVRMLERTYGLLRSGVMHEEYLLHCLSRLPEGTTEIYFHPCADPATAVTDRPAPKHHTYTELLTLTSPLVKQALSREGVELT